MHITFSINKLDDDEGIDPFVMPQGIYHYFKRYPLGRGFEYRLLGRENQ